tara:strand:- start:2773 stop:3051 length:279 start_codon:yes stop_codon:yes gene_type:complete
MAGELPTDAGIVSTLEKMGDLVTDRRWKVSPENLQSTVAWSVLVMVGALLEEFAQLDPDQRAWLFSVVRDKVSWLATVPGCKLAYEAWRQDR